MYLRGEEPQLPERRPPAVVDAPVTLCELPPVPPCRLPPGATAAAVQHPPEVAVDVVLTDAQQPGGLSGITGRHAGREDVQLAG